MKQNVRDFLLRTILATVSFIAPGIGHVYIGRLDWGFAFFIPFLILKVLIYTLSLTSPQVFFIGSLLLVINSTVSATTVFFVKENKNVGANMQRASLVTFAFLVIFFQARLNRFRAFTVPSETMAPTLVKGDTIVVDTQPSYAKDDLVVIQIPETNKKIVRRIHTLDGNLAWTTTDNEEKMDHGTFLLSAARGKVLYVIYSLKPGSWRSNPGRFLLGVH